ncbi:DNA mismatch repair protein MutS [Aspergillus navahoensis]
MLHIPLKVVFRLTLFLQLTPSIPSRLEHARSSSVIDTDIRHFNTKIIDTLVLQIKPTILLTSTRVNHSNLDGQSPEGENGARHYLSYQLDVRHSQEFSHSDARNKLIALEITSKHEERFKFLVPHNGLVDTDQLDAESLDFSLEEGRHLHMGVSSTWRTKVTLGCAGAILTYLQRRRFSNMFVNARTLMSLQTVESESHPSMKEGLSVYDLFKDFACTPQEKQRLRQIFLRPSVQLDNIHERHAFISVCLQADHYNPMNKMVNGLKHIKSFRQVLINLQKGIITGSGKVASFKATVWAALLAFVFYSIDVHDALKEASGGHGLLCLVLMMLQALGALEAAQLYTVDFDSSDEQGRAVVKPGLDRDLDWIKATYDGLNNLLNFDVDVNVIYFPQLGFSIAIPLTNRGKAAYDGADEGWELIFMTENRVYSKDFRRREMDEELGDIYGIICVYDLGKRVLHYKDPCRSIRRVWGDWQLGACSLLAMTQTVTCYNLIRPIMSEGNIIKVEGDRHLLQELTVSSYVPNDTLLGGRLKEQTSGHSQYAPEALRTGSDPSMLLLRGPNYSGKIAMSFTLTTHSFIPVESAEIGVVDKILLKSNSQDSVSQNQNSSMNDLQQISFDLNDEFGKGTCENDGVGLACGIFEHLLSLEDTPKVIAATHFHEILENELLRMSPRLQLGHMEVQSCAALNGISQAIVDRANELATVAARGENLIAACAMLSVDETKALQDAEELARTFLGLDLSDACEGKNVGMMLETLLNKMGEVLEDISVDTAWEECIELLEQCVDHESLQII